MVINNNSLIQITNNRNGDLNLQCLDHVESDLTWIVLPDNGSLTIPSDEKGGSNFVAIKSGNQANLTIENLDEPFRGLLKCISSSGQVVNVRVVGTYVRNFAKQEKKQVMNNYISINMHTVSVPFAYLYE